MTVSIGERNKQRGDACQFFRGSEFIEPLAKPRRQLKLHIAQESQVGQRENLLYSLAG